MDRTELAEIIKNIVEELEEIPVKKVEVRSIKKITEFRTASFIDECEDTYWIIMVEATVKDRDDDPFGIRYHLIFMVGLEAGDHDGVNCIAYHYTVDVLHYGPLEPPDYDQDTINALAEYLLREARHQR